MQVHSSFLSWVFGFLRFISFFAYSIYQSSVRYIAPKDFSHSEGFIFTLMMVSFTRHKIFSFMGQLLV